MTKPNTVIYHSADFDGIFCREIARKFLPPNTIFIGWNFGDPTLPVPNNPEITTYVFDLPADLVFGLHFNEHLQIDTALLPWKNLIWIDHHKSSIESHPPKIPGYRIDGVAACRLTWQWFLTKNGDGSQRIPLPSKQDFIDRNVDEPLAVRLAGEYDIWDHRDKRALLLQYGLRCQELDARWWDALFRPENDEVNRACINVLMDDGAASKAYADNMNTELCRDRTWIMQWEGLKFLCINSARFNSQLFESKDNPETGHEALLGFCFSGQCWTVSLYHAKHRTDLDLSTIAKKYGGGGHKGACGFTCKILPFLNYD